MIIKKGSWNNSLDILVDSENIEINKLFEILKKNLKEELIPIKLYQIGGVDDLNKDTPIYRSVSIKKINRMRLIDFEDWFETIIDQDYEYIKRNRFYGFRIIFYEKSIIWD